MARNLNGRQHIKPKPDGRTTISAKLTPGKDDDVIRWWEAIPQGERQGKLIELIRAAKGGDSTEGRVARIERQLQDLPGLIRDLLGNITVVTGGGQAAEPEKPKQSNEDMAARDAAMRKNKWNIRG